VRSERTVNKEEIINKKAKRDKKEKIHGDTARKKKITIER